MTLPPDDVVEQTPRKVRCRKPYQHRLPKRPWRCDVIDDDNEMVGVAFGYTEAEAFDTAKIMERGIKAVKAALRDAENKR